MKKAILLSLFALCLLALKTSAQSPKPKDSIPEFRIADNAAYTGKYKYEGVPFEYMEIAVKEGKLAYSGGQYIGTLTPVSGKKDEFDANGQALFTFIRNAEGRVTGLRIDYQGQTFFGDREIK